MRGGSSTGSRAMFNFEDALKLIGEQTVLCVGDLMLDDFVYGEVSRISPEAPAPVLAVTKSELVVGGAGNVARNIAALGARCIFVGVVGEDEASRTLMRALAAEALIEPHLVVDPSRPTTRKVRFVSEHHSTHLLRADPADEGHRLAALVSGGDPLADPRQPFSAGDEQVEQGRAPPVLLHHDT